MNNQHDKLELPLGSDRKLHEECGVVGIWGSEQASQLAYLGLFAQQHRGQEGCGIVTLDPQELNDESHGLRVRKSFHLVADAFSASKLQALTGSAAIGHVRYSTQGGAFIQNVQPFHFKTPDGPVAIAHNGNLTNAKVLREELEMSGSIFQSTSDTEAVIHLIARSLGRDLLDKLSQTLVRLKGAFSMVVLTPGGLFAMRDAFGFRPLVLGKVMHGEKEVHIVASESCAFDLMDAEFIREIEPGELLKISDEGLTSYFPLKRQPSRFCAFEPIYFSRPDSRYMGGAIYGVRKRLGEILAKEAPAPNADLVIAVPDSGVPMAMGFSQVAKLPLELGLVRNHYVGRTFIEPAQEIRDFGVKLKLNPIEKILQGKRIVVVDDSLVRGTTSKKIMRMLRAVGVKEIHMRIAAPPITYSCHYGVDTPERADLLAAQCDVDQIREEIGCDSIAYLSISGLKKALGDKDNHCMACFSGNYPESIFSDVPEQPTDAKGGPGLVSGS